jgi:hypothetical protein
MSMRNPVFGFFALLLTMQSVSLCAQTTQKTEPKFTLTIFDDSRPGGDGGYPFWALGVEETNISNETIVEKGCLEFHGVFNILILHNGIPVKERDIATRKKREAEWKLTGCKALAYNEIRPGESWTRYLTFGWDYPLSEPGTYEITVTRETDPEHPDKSVTVRSNTITITVPEPEATAPQ